MKAILIKICLLTFLLNLPLVLHANSVENTENNQDNLLISDMHTDLDGDCRHEITNAEKNRKLLIVNAAGIGIITAWGIAKWDYFTTSPKTTSEGWFENSSKSGGADKLGHSYTSYVMTHGLSYLYESWCINKKDAAIYGALSSLAIVTYMEIGDSFSEFGLSKEDIAANIAGAAYGYLSYRNPQLSNILDFRWEYKINNNASDFTTDYENSKYLLALKLNGFDFAKNNALKHIEFHAGYYTHGFADPDDTKERNVFLGIGINLTDLLRRHSYKKTATVLKYFQPPGTSLQFENDLNK